MILFMAFMILLMFIFVFAYPKYHANDVMAVFFGLFYVAIMLSYVYQIRMLERGLYLAFSGVFMLMGDAIPVRTALEC